MSYVTPIYGGSDAQVDYRLGLGHGCGKDQRLGYHLDARERPLVWVGAGLEAFGVPGVRAGAELTREQYDLARRLVRGQHVGTGEQLVVPKVAVPAAAKVAVEPLVAAVRQRAIATKATPGSLFTGPVAQKWLAAERAMTRRGAAAVTRVDDAVKLAEAAGLDPHEVWGAETVASAVAAMVRPEPVLDEAGEVVLDADGAPQVRLVPRRERVGVAAYDIGLTLPKSMSLLLAFAPEELTGRVEQSFTDAVNRTFTWTEDRTSYVRRGKHGEGKAARQEKSEGFSGWMMFHRAARPVGNAPIGDPHWHVHITVANMARAVSDGQWLTVASGGRDLMRHATVLDKINQAQVRGTLHRELGIEFTRNDLTGVWEVGHIPQATVELFSKRHHQVLGELAKLGYTNSSASAKEARVLTRTSRSAKSESTADSDATLREYWRAEARAAGQDPDVWMPRVLQRFLAGHTDAGEDADQTMRLRHGIDLSALVKALNDPATGLTATKRRFSELDAVAAVAEALPYGASLDEVEQLTEVVLAHPSFVGLPTRGALVAKQEGQAAPLAGSHGMAGGELYTTLDVTAAEQLILTAAKSLPDQSRAVVPARVAALAIEVTEAAQGYPLSAEQATALTELVTTGRAVETLEGPPGTGKTTLLRAARVAWEAAGYRVEGTATAAVATLNLAAESGISSSTVAQWRHRITTGQGLTGVDVLVLDEANLTSDRDRAALYAAAAKSGTKMVEVGDPKQLRGVGCGSMFGYLHALLEGLTLTENRRQLVEDERAALALFRSGNYIDALNRWDAAGGIAAHKTTEKGVAALAATWLRLCEGAPDAHTRIQGLLTIASTNEQVARINRVIQGVRIAEDHLGKGREFTLPGRRQVTFHVGDHVLYRINDRFADTVQGDSVFNGYRGVVTHVSRRGVTVEWRQPGDEAGQAPHQALVPPAYIADGGLELGYALTTHKAEGLTVDGQWARPDGTHNQGSVLVWVAGMDNPGLYVAASRDRGQVTMFGSLQELENHGDRLTYGAPADQAALTDRVKAALAERAKRTQTNDNDRPALVDLGRAPDVTELPASAGIATELTTALTTERSAALAAATQRWQTNPDSQLTDAEVSRRIAEHSRRADTARDEAREATTLLNQWSGPVAAGEGPLVRRAGELLEQLRRDTTIVERLDQLTAAANTAQQTSAGHYARATDAEQRADQTSRLRPGAAQALREQAHEHTEHARQAQAQAAALRAEHATVYRQLSPEARQLAAHRPAGDNPNLTLTRVMRDRLADAERSHPGERAAAQAGDEAAITRLRERAGQGEQLAAGHTSRRDALLDEQATRVQQPAAQRELETHWRTVTERERGTAAQPRDPADLLPGLAPAYSSTLDPSAGPDNNPRP